MGEQQVNRPGWRELWNRVVRADDIACDGGWQDSACPWCRDVVEALRGGAVHCPGCGHINAIGHSCSDWKCSKTFHATGRGRACRYVGPEPLWQPPLAELSKSVTTNPARVTVTLREAAS